MAKTKAEKEGWKPKDREEDVFIPEVVEDPVEAVKKLKPVDGLNYDNFINDLAENMQDVKKYSGVISGWFGRMRLNRQLRHVEMFDNYLQKLRLASDNAAQLQETLLKNKIIFQFQARLAVQRVKDDWDLERKGKKHQHAILDADISHKKFMKKFYDTTDPSKLSETGIMLLNMMQPIKISKSNTSSQFGSISEENVEYGSIEGMAKIKQQNQLMELLMKEQLASLTIKNAEGVKAKAQARREETQADLDEWTVNETIKQQKK
jgi:hypothetical protein